MAGGKRTCRTGDKGNTRHHRRQFYTAHGIKTTMNEKAIVCKDLTKQFGDFVAVDKISFEVDPGEIFGFLGANGAGKTTAMRMLCGLSYPNSGTAMVAGYNV